MHPFCHVTVLAIAALTAVSGEVEATTRTTVFPQTASSSSSQVTEDAILTASNFFFLDDFGTSVSASGNTVIVGARREQSAATGVDGDGTSNALNAAGAAYVFTVDSGVWSQQAYIKASNTNTGDFFGSAVSISGDTFVVGAESEDSPSSGVNGGQGNGLLASGAAYVFVRSGNTWSQQAYVKASNPSLGDFFAEAVAISGNTMVIGASGEDSIATGVNGDQSDGSSVGSGAAYVFVREAGVWSQQAYLKASNSQSDDAFGRSVAISGDTLVVGATQEDSNATGVNGDQSNNAAIQSGAAYVFVRNGGVWTQQAYLKASNTETNDSFGWSVSISGDTILVSSVAEDSAASGVNGDEANAGAPGSGAVYVFVRSGATWTQEAYLKASNPGIGDGFGAATAISANTAIIGADGEDSGSAGIDGDQMDGSIPGSGAAYVFTRNGSQWSQASYVKSSAPSQTAFFGGSVALLGDTAAVGAENVSLAYVFDLGAVTPSPWVDAGCALAGVAGDPALAGKGPMIQGTSNVVSLTNAAPGALSGLFVSFNSTPVPFVGGTLKAFPFITPTILSTNGAGSADVPFSLPPTLPAGITLSFQMATLDAVAVEGVALSNALSVTTN